MADAIASQFAKAAYMLKEWPNHKEISTDKKLQFHGLYKQSTAGDVSGEQPSALEAEERAKYDAWAAQKGKGRLDAMGEYIKLLADSDPNWQEHEFVKMMPEGWKPSD